MTQKNSILKLHKKCNLSIERMSDLIKFIGFQIFGHSLFKDGSLFSLQTSGQITSKSKRRVIQYNDVLSLNRVVGIVGINATGKSTLMKLFKGLNSLYILNLSIDQTELEMDNVFRSDNNEIKVNAFFATNDNVRYTVKTTFQMQPKVQGEDDDTNNSEWVITDEQVFQGKGKNISKSQYFVTDSELKNRSKMKPIETRQVNDEKQRFLSPKDSIFRAVYKTNSISNVLTTVPITDRNVARTFNDETPTELIEYLDNSIEYLDTEKNSEGKTISYTLKFKSSAESITVAKLEDVAKYVSSGTIKGITLFYEFLTALRIGATLFVDEIELHINKQIVRDFIGFFSDPKVNVNNATLVYSTHYIELTDDLMRKDEEYILIRHEQTNICRLSNADVRDELKNSEIFQSNTLRGTAPSYENYMALKRTVKAHIKPQLNYSESSGAVHD